MIRRSHLLILLILPALATLSCARNGSGGGLSAVSDGPSEIDVEIEPSEYEVDDYFEGEWPPLEDSLSPPFVLSEGGPDWDAGEARPPLAQTKPLTPEQVRTLLSRLPPVQEQEGDVEQVRLPHQVLPSPRPGVEVELPFPPPQAASLPDAHADAPLAVLRYSPEGDVPLAPQLSITFNQPMVPLTSHRELAREEVPVRLSPEPPGRWRWVGAQTLFFEAGAAGPARMPMATEYTVQIPAGTQSAGGRKLAEPVSWTFRTPPPTLQLAHPTSRSLGVAPVFYASFDQRIDPAAVLEHAQVTARGVSYALRLATEDEIAADTRVQRLAAAAPPDRWLAFVAVEPLPRDATVTVTFGTGTPSLEGPLVSARPQSYSFHTPGPFALRQHRCGWSDGNRCQPGEPWLLRFNNPVDFVRFDPALISVEPEPAAVSYEVYDHEIWIQAITRGNTTYTVTLDAELTDRFDQPLAEELQVRFEVGPAEAFLTAKAGGPITTLDPYARPVFPIYTLNLNAVKVRAFRVAAEQYVDYLLWRHYHRNDDRQDPPGELVMQRTLQLDSQADAVLETNIDLAGALDGDTGHLILYVEPQSGLLASLFNQRLRETRVVSWVQVTGIGLDAFVDDDEIFVWTNRLADGAPLPGVRVTLWPQELHGTTDETGSALLSLPQDSAQLLIARAGDDTAFLPENRYEFYLTESGWNGWRLRDAAAEARFYVFDDRKIYRPGETVSVMGWMRLIERSPEGDVSLIRQGGPDRLSYVVRDESNNRIDAGSVPLNALGGFHFQFDLPENVNLGYAWIELEPAAGFPAADEARHYHGFQIQEFRRPEFEVSARVSEGPHVAGGRALATVSAGYFAGGPLPNAEVAWEVEATSGAYEPPNWSGFIFGKWLPWWGHEDESGYLGRAAFTARTGAAGEHSLRIDFLTGANAGNGSDLPGRENVRPFPVHVNARATVFDVNRQAWSSGAGLLLHPADLYVGLRTERYFVEQGEPLSVEVVVTDIDGNAVAGHGAVVRAARLGWVYREGGWREIEKEAQECTVETTAAAAPDDSEHNFAACGFETPLGGEYRITATVTDEAGRRNRTELIRWVSGGQRPPSGNVEREELQLIPDGEAYAPGETAQILVQAPFFPAEGLVTLRRDGLVSSQRFTMDGPTHTLHVPIEEQYAPNIHVQVNLVGSAVRVDGAGNELPAAPRRPAYARGRLNLSIPPLSRTLQVDATPRALKLEPGAETTIDVSVRDASGAPVAGAEFAVVVVDEAILALTGYQLLDPVSVFYSDRGRGVGDHHSRADLVLASPQALPGATPAPTGTPQPQQPRPEMLRQTFALEASAPAMAEMAMGDDMAEESMDADGGGEAIRVRLNYDPLALFAPEVRTDADGQASVSVTLPDNLTRYRVMVVAVAGGKFFGSAASNLTARLPLMVRPSAPRFLNFGDSFELPVVLQNQTDAAMVTHVVVRATNADLVAESGGSEAVGYALEVPANDRVEVRFPTQTAGAGTARFQFAAVAANQPAIADAAEIDLPVFTPATTEAFAVYGEIDANGAVLQTLRPPTDAVPSYGGLEVTISSTALQALTDAFIYLVRYPYECSEQIASRILGVAALRDVLTAFDAEGLPTPAEIEIMMDSDLQTLQALQDYGGGFPIWRRGGEVWPYHSVHVAHALARARLKGYAVPEDMLSRSLDYLRTIEDHFPSWYGAGVRRGLSSYALYVRKLLDDDDPSKARRLINEAGLENLSLESVGWLLFVLSDDPASHQTVAEMRRFLNNRVTETAGAATVASGYGDGAYLLLHSSRRADAVLLEALVVDQPNSDLITKLVRGLLGHRAAGRWSNTQENVWVLLALDRYFNAFESQTPDFVARIWLGERYAGGHAFEGRSTENVALGLPMQYLRTSADETDGDLPLTLQKEGQGRLYYRLGLRYAPLDLRLDAADRGFTVERVYEAVDDPADVRRDEDGKWHIRAGARVRVKLVMAAPSRRVHVALVDPLPAGLEILNPELAVTGDLGDEPNRNRGRWWGGSWYRHQNLRDERAEAFTPYLWAGVYQYSYMARATTPGVFVAPPAKAEEMYAPETFGRSGTDWVVVEVNEE